jgi:hypothetical protein
MYVGTTTSHLNQCLVLLLRSRSSAKLASVPLSMSMVRNGKGQFDQAWHVLVMCHKTWNIVKEGVIQKIRSWNGTSLMNYLSLV